MKQNKIFILMVGLGISAVVSCNNTSDATAANQDSTSTNTTTESPTSSNDNTAFADEIENNSAEGNYINPKTGKSYGKLSVNRKTGEITNENNEPYGVMLTNGTGGYMV